MSSEPTGASPDLEQLILTLLMEKDALLAERAMLLEEMQHRVANSLQIIASVLMIKARAASSEQTRLDLRDAHDRVLSVAAVQAHLQLGVGVVELEPYFANLCASLAASMIGDARPLTLDTRVDAATVNSRQAVNLGLIITELVINALKHAFPDDRAGHVQVAYETSADGWVLSVTDDGVGRREPTPGERVGLGTNVVKALARQLHARVEFSDAGPGTRVALVSVEPEPVEARANPPPPAPIGRSAG